MRFSARKSGFLAMKRKTRLEFFKKPDLMMNFVVKCGFGGGACGKGESGYDQDPESAVL
jgi:hypothetical protein